MRWSRVALVLVASVLAPGQSPQHPRPDTEELPRIQVEVDVVNILCTVRDSKGRLIPDLGKDDFLVTEDGQPQEIRYFSRETDLPLTIGLLVDVSKSQENLIEIEKEAAYQFLNNILREKDLAFLMTFGVEAELLQDLTNSRRLLHDALEKVRLNAAVGGILPGPVPNPKPKGTVLYDAIFLASDEILRKEAGRKVVVVITDGVDVGSVVTLERALEAAQKADTLIYGIYYADPRYQWWGNGYGVLKRLAEETGGRVFRVGRQRELSEIFAQIQQEVRSQYSLGYTPTRPIGDGSYRRIKVITKRPGLKVQARKGYYAIKRG